MLTDADRFVLTYLESNSSQIPCQTLESLRQKLDVGTTTNQPADQSGKKTNQELSVSNTHLPVDVFFKLVNFSFFVR